MEEMVRCSIFETNSSSTHSLWFGYAEIDELDEEFLSPKQVILKIAKANNIDLEELVNEHSSEE